MAEKYEVALPLPANTLQKRDVTSDVQVALFRDAFFKAAEKKYAVDRDSFAHRTLEPNTYDPKQYELSSAEWSLLLLSVDVTTKED